MVRPADVLSAGRLLAAPAFAGLLAGGGWWPLLLVGGAVASDVLDGPIARRRSPPSRHGGVLDAAADVTFVLCGTIAAARLGLLPWLLPAAIACAVAAFARASVRLSRGAPAPRLAFSVIGHAAGIGNWVATALAAGAVATPWDGWPVLLPAGGVLVAGLNLLAAAERIVR